MADALGARAGHDAALIAEARNALPALLDRVERLEALLVAVRDTVVHLPPRAPGCCAEHEGIRRCLLMDGHDGAHSFGRYTTALDVAEAIDDAIEAKRAALAALEEP